MPATVRVGIAGVRRGAVLHRALALQPGCEVIAVCSGRADSAQQYAAQQGVARAYASYEAAVPGGHGDGEYWMAQDFLRAVRGEAPPAIDVYDAVEYTLPGILAQQSALAGGRPVEIPNVR